MLEKIAPLFAIWLLIVVSGCADHAGNTAHPVQSPSNEAVAVTAASKPLLTPTLDYDSAEEPEGLVTLRQAIAFALANSPQLRAFSWDLHTAEANRMQAALLPNPKLEVEVGEFGGTGGRRKFRSSESSIQIGQFIELAQKRSKRIHLATIEKQLAEWDYKSKRLDVMNQVTGAFIDTLAAQERLALAKELVRLADKTYNAVAMRVKAGKDSPLEETKAKVALSTVTIASERAAQALQSARTLLAVAWGKHTPAFREVMGSFYEVTPVPGPDDLAVWISQNPDIARWPVEKQRYFAALKLEKAKATSDITVKGGVQQLNEGDDTTFILGLAIPIPMFNRNQAGIKRATYAIAKADENRRAVEINIHAALSQAARKLQTAFAEANVLADDVLPGAQSAFDAAELGYREGKFNYLDVLDAQRTLFQTKAGYIESLTAYHKTKVAVERLIAKSIDSITDTRQNNQKEPN